MKNKFLAVRFTKGCFRQFVDGKFKGLNTKVLPACSNARKISKFPFQISVQVYSLLDQTEGERKAFLEGTRRGATV